MKRRSSPGHARPRAAALAAASCSSRPASDYAVADVPMTAVKLGGFWGGRQATDIAVTIAHQLEENERTGRIKNFELAAAALRGEPAAPFAIPLRLRRLGRL